MQGQVWADMAPRQRLGRLREHMLLRPCAAAQLPPPTDERCGEALAAGMTASQLAHYHEFGFVVLRSLYDAAEVEGLRAEFEQKCAQIRQGACVSSARLQLLSDTSRLWI